MICTCAYIRSYAPSWIDAYKKGYVFMCSSTLIVMWVVYRRSFMVALIISTPHTGLVGHFTNLLVSVSDYPH